MAVVPITKNSPPPAQAAPPEPALLMALAEMHKQGRFDQSRFKSDMEDTRAKVDIQNIHDKGNFPRPEGYSPQVTGKGKVDIGYEY